MSRFHQLKIKNIRRETPDCVSVAFDVPAELREAFSYTPGQYLTLRREHQGEELRRSYSICSSPLDDEWRVAIKKVPEGRFSTLAVENLHVGDTLDVMPPQGRFSPSLHPAQAKRYALFAAGSGITPILSIAKTVLLTEPDSHVYLIYGNRGRNSIIFKEAIEGLKNKFLHRLSVYHVLSREQGDSDLFFGRLDYAKTAELLQKMLPAARLDEAYICGPEEMIHGVRQALVEAGVAAEKIHFELFATSSSPANARANAPRPVGEDDQKSQVTVRLDGRAYPLAMSYYGDTVLDALLAVGVDAPYSCKNGMCSTCRARVTAGTTEMDVNYSLSDTEVAKGYVLTCQARPTSPEVTVDFDQ
ncbi:1,2-phenylacetyl-CoA epoxidase subunit PaaE [Hymenobacter properus]|uniref:Phenylacetate-CoA oxygenase/reductase subunit PaaK n=1 Tax=Hymenobacter properus TaxID=2791026 RepID=A0A931BN78_9BACT|nr:1,2-phenylacetyl-CoA epoxidase subunit PaaE [Hymenobacter properus]MBF9142510.1 phenylacetate-CoA oxygenase/reductase subunit PaaK [Hymenobacter properus]MBR7721317.1 phenylacetate-CoA oxygenase/reductase subunit PaaK [Microvirga sp. SRT04]